ncbi:MAG: hypothetical protein ABIT01_02060 [Thermoanaerobaculia bacterium]
MNVIKTRIPLLQPDGYLSVPRDDWAALNRLLEILYGGHLHVWQVRERGLLVVGGDGKGLPCVELDIEVPDTVSPQDVVNGEFDKALRQTLTRNIRSVREPIAA